MKRQVTLTNAAIDEVALVAQRAMSHGMGAAVYFVGVVRGTEEGQDIGAIEYEAFAEMVQHQFELIFQEMERRWPVVNA